MTVTITSNKKYNSAVVHFNASANVVVAGNTSASNLAILDETLVSGYIAQAIWGCDLAGTIQVKRGGALIAVYGGTGSMDYAGTGMPLNVNPTANIDVSFVGSANCYLYLEVQKTGNFSSNNDYFKV